MAQGAGSPALIWQRVRATQDPLYDRNDRVMPLGVCELVAASLCVVTTSVRRSRASRSLMILRSVNASNRDSQMPNAVKPSAFRERSCGVISLSMSRQTSA